MNDMISIIMPAFAIEKHLHLFENAISGIINQTYTNWELIIAVDGGSKKTIDIIKKITSKYKDNRIRVFKSEKQMGPGIIRNMCIKYVHGNYLSFHDSDDYSEPNRFELLMKNMNKNGIVASNVTVKYLYDKTNNSTREKKYSGESLSMLIDHRKVRAPCHLPSTIISKHLFIELGGFEQYKYSSDAILAIKLSCLMEISGIGKIPIIDKQLFIWNRHSHSITTMFDNAYKLKKCQSAQRKPLIRVFREKYLRGEISSTSKRKDIMSALGLVNNFKNLQNLIEV